MSIGNCGTSAIASAAGSDHVLNFRMTTRVHGSEDVTFAHIRLEMKGVVGEVLKWEIFALVTKTRMSISENGKQRDG